MRRLLLGLSCVFCLLACDDQAVVSDRLRVRVDLDQGWKFRRTGFSKGIEKLNYKDQSWGSVDLPNDWRSGEGYAEEQGIDNGYLKTSKVCYRKSFVVDGFEDKRASLHVEGVQGELELWLNGEKLGRHIGFGGSVHYDIDSLQEGENVLLIEQDITKLRGPYYQGGGLVGQVYVELYDSVHIQKEKQWWKAQVNGNECSLRIQSPLRLGSFNANDVYELAYELSDGEEVFFSVRKELSGVKGTAYTFDDRYRIDGLELWTPTSPKLYQLKTRLFKNGVLHDFVEQEIGLREVGAVSGDMMLLNGENLSLKALRIHFPGGAEGLAMDEQRILRRLSLLKKLGANTLLLQDDLFPPRFYRSCDRLGFLVLFESYADFIETRRGLGTHLEREEAARSMWDEHRRYACFVEESRDTAWLGALKAGLGKLEYAFDYMEVGDWPSRMRAVGLINGADYPKAAYYALQSEWTDVGMLHVEGNWACSNSAVGDEVIFDIYSNCDTLVCLLNGNEVLRKALVRGGLRIDLPYQQGELVFQAYLKGELCSEKRVKTAGRPYKLALRSEATELKGDEGELVFIEVFVLDKYGVEVPCAKGEVSLFVASECGDLIMFDSGDPNDVSAYSQKKKHLYQGKLFAYVKSKKGLDQPLKVTVTSDDRIEGHLLLMVK